MDLTTLARVKLAFEKAVVTDDSALQQAITEVSDGAAHVMNRHVEKSARTEYQNIQEGQRVFQLRGFGDPASVITSVYHDVDRLFAGTGLIDPTDYTFDPDTGLLYLDFNYDHGPRSLKVTYSGGMADSAANFVTRYAAVAQAVEQQVVHFWQTRGHLGLTSFSFQGGSIGQQEAGSRWLPWVLDVLNRHKLYAL